MKHSGNSVNRKYQDYMWGYIFIAPTMIGIIALNIWPIIKTLILSFSNDLGFGQYEISGLSNYKELINDNMVWISLKNTLIFTFGSVPIGIIIALILAAMMSSKIRGSGLYRVIYFMPMVAAPAAIAMVWRWMYNTDYGLLNAITGYFGFNKISWMSDPKYAMASMIVIAIWGGIGYQIIILIAAITAIPKQYYEAAEIDGAGPIRKAMSLTLPLISPSIFFLSITGIISAMRQFDLVFMLYNNTTNPAINSVRTIMYYYYDKAFNAHQGGYASAIAIVLLFVVFVFTMAQFYAEKKWVHYE